jgi:hypothetical protein
MLEVIHTRNLTSNVTGKVRGALAEGRSDLVILAGKLSAFH